MLGDFEDVHLAVAGGVVDEQIKRSQRVLDLVEQPPDRPDFGEVSLKDFPPAALGGFKSLGFGSAVVHRDASA